MTAEQSFSIRFAQGLAEMHPRDPTGAELMQEMEAISREWFILGWKSAVNESQRAVAELFDTPTPTVGSTKVRIAD